MDYTTCPACSSADLEDSGLHHSVSRCRACGAIFGGPIYLGDSHALVSPLLGAETPGAETRYFDFQTLGSQGLGRRHGWYEPRAGRPGHLVQVG